MGVPMPYYPHMQNPMQPGFAYPYGYAAPNAQFPTPQFPNTQFPNTQYHGMPEGVQRNEAAGIEAKKSAGGENDNKPKHIPIKISPPTQFDQNRPFYFNGHMVFPPMGLPQGQMAVPTHMAPMVPSNYFPPATMAPAMYPSQRVSPAMQPVSNMAGAGPHIGSSGPPPPPYPTAVAQSPVQQEIVPPAPDTTDGMPPLSSIRPSEITRKQLEGLRVSLKYYIGQLQFNRHQIDEPWVFAQAQKVRAHIKQFEENLEKQVRYETRHYPNMEPTPRHIMDGFVSSNTPSRPPSVKQAQASGSSHHGSNKSNGAGSMLKFFPKSGSGNRPGHKPNRLAVGINSNKNNNSTAHIDAFEADLIKKLSAPGATEEQKAMLEAITRPLNPNYNAKPSVAQQASGDNSSSQSSSAQPGHSDEKKPVQGQMLSSGPSLQNPRGSGETAQSGAGTYLNGNGSFTALVNGNGSSMPYLIGRYPQGTDPWTYDGYDFLYARDLTDVEKQARRAYWIQQPTKGTGLPKFDGKDFYPPSPQKAPDTRAPTRNVPSGRPETDFGSELKRSEFDPFRSSRDGDSIRSYESGRRVNKAIPIVAPPDADRKAAPNMPALAKDKAKEGGAEVDQLGESMQGCKLTSPEASKKKSPPLNRRAVERSR